MDASAVDFEAILLQIVAKRKEQQILTYESRQLTDTEQRYSQTKLKLSLLAGPSTSMCTFMAR